MPREHAYLFPALGHLHTRNLPEGEHFERSCRPVLPIFASVRKVPFTPQPTAAATTLQGITDIRHLPVKRALPDCWKVAMSSCFQSEAIETDMAHCTPSLALRTLALVKRQVSNALSNSLPA